MSRKMQDKTLPLPLTSKHNLERTLSGRCAVDWSLGNQKTEEDEEKALVGGEPAEAAGTQRPNEATQISPRRRSNSSKGTKRPRVQPLAQAYPQVGEAIHQALLDLDGSNPDGGVQTILEALVEVAAPPERMPDLFALGQRRLEQQQQLLTIPNPTGYLIGIMRNMAVEGMLKGWNVDQMRAEDEEKHEQALRSAAHAEISVLTYESDAATQEEAPPAASGLTDVDPPAALTPNVPEGVEVADAATVATWRDHMPDPQTGQPRSISMLWGFVRDEVEGHLNIARRQHLDALVPRWDATRPRTLLLLCHMTYTARAVELTLRREIEPPFDRLLSQFFDEFRVVYAWEREEPA